MALPERLRRWVRHGSAAGREGDGWQAHAYGPGDEQYGELWLPEGRGPHAAVVVVHGGFWRRRYGCELMHPLAGALRDAGLAAWNIEYRRVGSPGGGWPGTLLDVAAAVDYLVGLRAPLDLSRVGVIGHSAGGHLAMWTAGRASLQASDPGSGPRLVPRAVVSLAGVLDLADAARRGLGGGAAVELLGATPSEAPGRYRVASPAERLPVGAPQLLVHGDRDANVPLDCSQTHRDRAVSAGDPVTLAIQPGVGHFEVIDPRHLAGRIGVQWLGEQLAAPRAG